MAKWALHRDNFYRRLPALGVEANFLTSSKSGSVIVTHAKIPAFKGTGRRQPYAVIGLCTRGGGRTRKEVKGRVFENVWSPGKVGFALPSPAGTGFSPAMESIAIAFEPSDVVFSHGEDFDLMTLASLNYQLFQDELVAAVMLAMLRDAEAHGASTVFFDHGLSLILNRLRKYTAPLQNQHRPALPNTPINEIFALIEERLGEDLRVTQLAEIFGVSPRTFTRIFKRETGYTPFMYLTKRRMHRAKELLNSDYSVTEIAMAVGYENPAKFAAAFRRWEGISPSMWRLKR